MPLSLCYGLLAAHLPARQHIPCPFPIFCAGGLIEREKSLSASEPGTAITPEEIINYCLGKNTSVFFQEQRRWSD